MIYRNPVLYADYSDPDVIRIGEDYYMVASSFTYLPGVPLLHSRDLVHWEIINYCVRSLPFEKYDLPSHGSGTWAPSIRCHEGTIFVFVPLPDEGIMVCRSKDPYGVFECNMLCSSKGWIDPCPFWDEDGKAYMIFAYARSRCGMKHRLALVEINPDCTCLLGEPRVIFEGKQIAPTTEGPKMYKKDGKYYILMPSGGVASGWQSALRSEKIWGPYEYRIVMHQGNTQVNGPHQGGWVDTPEGTDWFVHFQDVGSLGRIVHLQPVCWNGGWPFIGEEKNGDGIGEPVDEWDLPREGQPCYEIATSDDFDTPELGFQWQWQANPRSGFYSLTECPGKLHLYCLSLHERENLLWYAPNVLTQIPQSPDFEANVSLRLFGGSDGDMAALGITGHRYAYVCLCKEDSSFYLCLYQGNVIRKEYEGEAEEVCAVKIPYPSDHVFLRVELGNNGEYHFSWSQDERTYQPIGGSFQLSKGTWTGAKLCLWAANRKNISSRGYGSYDYIHIKDRSGRKGSV